MKREISVWELLIWVYNEQSTRHMIDGQRSDRLGWGRISMTQKAMGAARQGCHVQEDTCRIGRDIHDDAWMVHNVMVGLADRFEDHSEIVHSLMVDLVGYSEDLTVPPYSLERVPPKVEPVWKNDMKLKPKMILDRRRHGIACLIKILGHVSDEHYQKELDDVRDDYSRFVLGLQIISTALKTQNLKDFTLQGIGVPEQPWVLKREKIKQAA